MLFIDLAVKSRFILTCVQKAALGHTVNASEVCFSKIGNEWKWWLRSEPAVCRRVHTESVSSTHLCLQKHLTDACSSSSASRYARCRVRCGLFWGQALRSVNFFLCAAQRVKSAATRASGHSAFLRKVRSGKRPSEGWEVVMSWKSADTFHMKNVGRIWIWAPPLSALSLDTLRQVCLSGR